MYGLVFALLVLVIAGIYYHYNPQSKEGFTSVTENPLKENPQLGKILLPPVSPEKLRPSPVDKVVESEPTNALPSAPFRETGDDRPLPPNDPANTRTKYIRIRRAYEDLSGFFNNEAQVLEGTSDPAIQQPLTLAKSDLTRLQDELTLLDRNQGLEPTLTEKDMLEVNANLRYLQRESRLRDINGVGAYASTEGFASNNGGSLDQSSAEGGTEGFADMLQEEDEEPFVTGPPRARVPPMRRPTAATTIGGNKSYLSAPSRPKPKPVNRRATVKDLVQFNTRVWAEAKRISASGSTNPVARARVQQLEKIRSDINDILARIKRGDMKEIDIPIFMNDIQRAYPILGDMTKPLPQLLAKTGLPPELQNLLPPGVKPSGSQTEQLIMKYVQQILDNTELSFNFGVHYVPPNFNKDKLAGTTRIPATVRASKGQVNDASAPSALAKGLSMFADARYHNPQDPSATPAGANMVYQARSAAGVDRQAKQSTKPGHLDWEKKTKEICEAVRARGLNPRDFACPAVGAKFSPGYGWRGHAKMVCSRLQTAPESGTPQLVGCPPDNWVGWNLSY